MHAASVPGVDGRHVWKRPCDCAALGQLGHARMPRSPRRAPLRRRPGGPRRCRRCSSWSCWLDDTDQFIMVHFMNYAKSSILIFETNPCP
eukprot:2000813-Pleurochrysis_carterae.AAC.3